MSKMIKCSGLIRANKTAEQNIPYLKTMNQLEKVFKALANRRRLFIVRYLKMNEEATVTDLAHELRLSLRATSRHLVKLAACDILEREQRRLEGYYRLSRRPNEEIEKIISVI